MPIDTSIYSNIKQPTQYSLGDIMGLATAKQRLDTGQIEQQRSGIALEQERSNLGAQKAIGAVISDPQFHDPETGLFDLNRASPVIIQADPQDRFASKIISNLAKANADLITVKKASLGLADTSRTMLGSAVGALATKPDLSKADVAGVLTELEGQAPDTKPIIDVWKRGLANLPDDPKALQQVVMKARSQVMPPTPQIESQTPSGPVINDGRFTAQFNTKPTAGETGPVPGAVVQNQVPPTAAESVGTDVNGNPIRVVRDPQGRITLQPISGAAGQGAGGQVGGGSSGAPPMYSFPRGESAQSAQDLSAMRMSANRAASSVPTQHFNSQQIIKLADETNTGVGAQYAANLRGQAAGIPWTSNSADNYGRLMHYLALQSQTNSQAMGAGTDAARDMAEKATASSAWTKEAIKSATKVNDALATGVELYNRGLESAINDPNNPKGIFAARDFQNAWSRAFDVNAMRLQNAINRGDRQEQEDVIRSVGGRNSPGAKALADKMRALDALISGGGR